MLDSRKITIIIKVIVVLIFFILIEYAIQIVYSHEIENDFFSRCQNSIKFIVSELEIMNPGIVSGKIDDNKLQDDINKIFAYYEIEKSFNILIFKKDTGTIIYPIYSKKRNIKNEIELGIREEIEGKIKNKNFIGYYFFYKPADLSMVVYKSRDDVYYYRNILLIAAAIIFIFLMVVLLIVDIRKNRRDLNFYVEFLNNIKEAFKQPEKSISLKEIKNIENHGKMEEQLIKNYNRMVNRINIIIQRQNKKIREISKQRSNLRKLAYYYKKYSFDLFKTEDIDKEFVSRFANSRIPIVVLSLKLINYFDEISEIYPEVINRELEGLYRYVVSVIKSKNGFINYFEGNYFNIVYGLMPDGSKKLDAVFNTAVQSAKDIHNWILSRNKNKNITGVLWEEAIGITGGKGIVGVIGNNLIVIGEVVDSSRELMQLAQNYGVKCITDAKKSIKDIKLSYRVLDRLKIGFKNNNKEIYEIFLEEHENIDNAIKLYHHGMEMYFEENYEISATEFKKVNQLLNPDNPSLIFLKRINSKISKK